MALPLEPAADAAPPIPALPDGAVARVFAYLSPRELAVASAVSAGWHGLSAGSDAWRRFYAGRWPLPAAPGDAGGWQRLYGARALGARCWAAARPQQDQLLGHSGGVRAVALLEEQGLAFTGSTDGTVRAWSLPSGVSLGASRQHGGSVRCLAADATTLASGCSDGNIRLWQSSIGSGGGGGDGPRQQQQHPFSQVASFRLGGPRSVLPGGHSGPVTGLALLPGALLSGSWDQTVRIWDRSAGSGEVGACASAHRVGDWVTSLEVCDDRCLVAAGASVAVASLAGGGWRALHALPSPSGAVTSAAGSLDGRCVWFSTAGGSVVMSDQRCPGRQQVEIHSARGAVSSLSWRDPWLAVAEQGGLVTLLDVEAQRRGGQRSSSGGSAGGRARGRATRVLYSPGSGGAALGGCMAVCLGDQWAAAGFDMGAAVTWDASGGVPDPSAQQQASPQKKRRQQRREPRADGGARAGGPPRPSAAPVPIQSRSLPSAFPSAPEAGGDSIQGQGMAAHASGRSPPGSALTRLGTSPSGTRRLVPAPVSLAHTPSSSSADGRCRRQAWQVLGATRGGRAAEGGATPPPAAGARAPPEL